MESLIKVVTSTPVKTVQKLKIIRMTLTETLVTDSSSKTRRSHSRIQPLLNGAAKLFATKGYKETTMRDIAAEVGMLPGSMYYHFKSKQELLLAVYTQAVIALKTKLESAIALEQDPWKKLEIAIITHVETILDQNDFARIMIGVIPEKAPEIQQELTAMRDSYEQIFIDIIDDIPLKKGLNKTLFRLMLLGALNSTQIWFHQGAFKPADIGREFIRYLESSVVLN